MTAYVAITEAQTDPGAPGTSELWKQWRDNPIAISEGATDAPVLSSGWHPFDMVTVDDGTTGLIYDFSVDGTVASVVSPTMVDGYDYLLHWKSISGNFSGNWRLNSNNFSGTSGTAASGWIEILAPTDTNRPRYGWISHRQVGAAFTPGVITLDTVAATPFNGMFAFSNFATALTTLTLDRSAGSINGGQVYLFRRRNFMYA